MHYPLDTIWSIAPTSMRAVETLLSSHRLDSHAPGPRAARTQEVAKQGRVGIIPITGILTKTDTVLTEMFGGTTLAGIRNAVTQAARDDSIDAIILRVDSPGGSVDGLADAGDAIYSAAKVKPVIAQVEGTAASAAYYLTSQATRVFASSRNDQIGSLGVRLMLYDMHRMAEAQGIEAVPIDTAPEDRPFKSAAAPGTKITDAQRADFQRIVNAYGEDFRKTIARGRGLGRRDVDAVFDGRIYLARSQSIDAMRLGLIDDVQPIGETAKQLAAGTITATATSTPRMDAAKRGWQLDIPKLSPKEEVMALDETRVQLEGDHRAAGYVRLLDEARVQLAQAWAICTYSERQGREMTDDERKRHADFVADAESRIEIVQRRIAE